MASEAVRPSAMLCTSMISLLTASNFNSFMSYILVQLAMARFGLKFITNLLYALVRFQPLIIEYCYLPSQKISDDRPEKV